MLLTRYAGARIVWDQGDLWLRADFRDHVEETCFGPEAAKQTPPDSP